MRSPLWLYAVSVLLVCSCEEPKEERDPSLATIEIVSTAGNILDLAGNQTTQLSVVGYDKDGNVIPVTSEVKWSTDDYYFNVDNSGLVTPVVVGKGRVFAEVGAVFGSLRIKIFDSTAEYTNFYVCDSGNNGNGPYQIIQYDEEGEFPVVYISSHLAGPQDMVVSEDQGVMLVSNLGTNSIERFAIQSGNFIDSFITDLDGPTRMEIGPDGLLYIISWNGGPVKRYELNGTFVDDFTSIGVNQALGMTWDADGNLYVSSWGDGSNGSIRKFNSNGDDLGLFVSANLSGPADIWFNNDGKLFVNDRAGDSIKKFDADGAYLGITATIAHPEGIGKDKSGTLFYVGNGTSGSVGVYSSEGEFLINRIAPRAGGLITPNAIVVRNVNW